MAKNNSAAQLKASSDFGNTVGLAVLRTCQEAHEVQSYITDPSFLREITEITADALHARYGQDAQPTADETDGKRRS